MTDFKQHNLTPDLQSNSQEYGPEGATPVLTRTGEFRAAQRLVERLLLKGFTYEKVKGLLVDRGIIKRFKTIPNSATPSINTDICDTASIVNLAQAITSFTTNLQGSPQPAQPLIIELTDNGTAYGITWGTKFEASTVALPTTTVISNKLTVGFIYNTATSKWRCVATA